MYPARCASFFSIRLRNKQRNNLTCRRAAVDLFVGGDDWMNSQEDDRRVHGLKALVTEREQDNQ